MKRIKLTNKDFLPLLIELVVVFCGVYLAFWLNGYQEGQRDKNRKVEYCKVFAAELTYLSNLLGKNATRLDSIHTHYKNEIHAKNQPELEPVHVSFDYKGVITGAVAQDKSFDALGIELVRNISLGTNTVFMIENRFRRYQRYTENILVPNLDKGRSEFYNPKTGMLNKKYLWYLEGLEDIVKSAKFLKMIIDDRALPDVRAVIQALEE